MTNERLNDDPSKVEAADGDYRPNLGDEVVVTIKHWAEPADGQPAGTEDNPTTSVWRGIYFAGDKFKKWLAIQLPDGSQCIFALGYSDTYADKGINPTRPAPGKTGHTFTSLSCPVAMDEGT